MYELDVRTNLALIEEDIREKLSSYAGMIVTNDNVAYSKKVLAKIRKEKKELDDSRKEVKRKWMEPYEQFEEKVKKLIALYDGPIEEINDQIKEVESLEKESKKKAVIGLYEALKAEDDMYAEWIPFERLYSDKWLNKTYPLDDIKAEFKAQLELVKIGIESIKMMESAYESVGLDAFKRTGDYRKAMLEMSRAKELCERIEAEKLEKAVEEAVVESVAEEMAMEFGEPEVSISITCPVGKKEMLVEFLEANGIEWRYV